MKLSEKVAERISRKYFELGPSPLVNPEVELEEVAGTLLGPLDEIAGLVERWDVSAKSAEQADPNDPELSSIAITYNECKETLAAILKKWEG